jgi:intein/homing endonuclease
MDNIDRLNMISECRRLREGGFSIGEIARILHIPKTTVYGYVKDILLTDEQKGGIEERRKLFVSDRPSPRKGKCIPGREILKPKTWSKDLMHVVAHFMFDGRIENHACAYYSSSKYQIEHLRKLVNKIFKAESTLRRRNNNTFVLSFYNIELVNYIKQKINEIFKYLDNEASREEKRIFLQTFFDDEGNIFYNKDDKRRVRGYQKSYQLLQKIQKFLEEFNISSRISKDRNEIEISGRRNLMTFANEINFSPGIYINPFRKNSIWRKKIQKREILKLALSSYKNSVL